MPDHPPVDAYGERVGCNPIVEYGQGGSIPSWRILVSRLSQQVERSGDGKPLALRSEADNGNSSNAPLPHQILLAMPNGWARDCGSRFTGFDSRRQF